MTCCGMLMLKNVFSVFFHGSLSTPAPSLLWCTAAFGAKLHFIFFDCLNDVKHLMASNFLQVNDPMQRIWAFYYPRPGIMLLLPYVRESVNA